MKFFEYQPKNMGRIWSLFYELYEEPEEAILGGDNSGFSYSHTLDIVRAAMSGSIATESDRDIYNFSLKAYEIGCIQNEKLDQKKDVEKYLFIVDDFQSEEEQGRVGFGDISSRKLESMEKAFEKLDSMVSFESSLCELLEIRDKYIVEQGIDIVSVVKSAVKGISDSLEVLKGLIVKNSRLEDLVVCLCEDSEEGLLMQRLSEIV